MNVVVFPIIVLIFAAIVCGCCLYKKQCTTSRQNDRAKASTSNWAIISLIASVLGGPFGLSIFGIIFGTVALVCIHRKKGQLSGKNIAVVGIAIGVVGGFFFYSMLLSEILEARAARHRIKCHENIEAIVVAIRQYASAHDDYLPARSNWKNAVSPFLRTHEDVFSCPEETRENESYIYLGNSTMKITDELWTGRELSEPFFAERQQSVPLVCESRVRHTRKCGDTLGVGFANGTTRRINISEFEASIPFHLKQLLPLDIVKPGPNNHQ